MGDIASVTGGGTPSTSNPLHFNGTIPWITPADLSHHIGKTIAGGDRYISEEGMEKSGAKWLPQGTVLFSSRAPIGYVAIASRPVTTNQGFKSFTPADGMTSDYLYYWLSSAKPIAEELASGTTFLEISGAKAAQIPCPVAPIAEQTRIVEKLEELLSDLDAGVAELKAAQKKPTPPVIPAGRWCLALRVRGICFASLGVGFCFGRRIWRAVWFPSGCGVPGECVAAVERQFRWVRRGGRGRRAIGR